MLIITGFLLLYSEQILGNKGVFLSYQDYPRYIKYEFRPYSINGQSIEPIFHRKTIFHRISDVYWKNYFLGEPNWLIQFRIPPLTVMVFAKNISLTINKEEVFSSEYSICIVITDSLAIYGQVDSDLRDKMFGLVKFYRIRENLTINYNGFPAILIVPEKIEVCRKVFVDFLTWEYWDNDTSYGTWYFFIKQKPETILLREFNIVKDVSGIPLGNIYYIDKNASIALPVFLYFTNNIDHDKIAQLNNLLEQERNNIKLVKQYPITSSPSYMIEYKNLKIKPDIWSSPIALKYNSNLLLTKMFPNKHYYAFTNNTNKKFSILDQMVTAFLVPPPIQKVFDPIIVISLDQTRPLGELVLVDWK